jgi:hypothetical protein
MMIMGWSWFSDFWEMLVKCPYNQALPANAFLDKVALVEGVRAKAAPSHTE